MKNDFIYDVMRSEEIREYYRKNVELDTEEQESVIMNCYHSLEDQLKLLIKLRDTLSNDEKNHIEEMISLYQLFLTIYHKPYEFFGNGCKVVYVLHYLVPLCILNDSIEFKFKSYTESVEYFNNVEEIIEIINRNEYIQDKISFEIDILVIPNNDNPPYSPIEFYCENIDGIFNPLYCLFDRDLFDQYINRETSRRYRSTFRYKGMPFKSGDRIKFQTPTMNKPFYGIISCEQDYPIDPNSCWYNFVYKDGTNIEDFDKSKILFDMSYTNIGHSSSYAIFDWLERA